MRTLTITRKKNFVGCAVQWGVKLDGRPICKIGDGETQSLPINEQAHSLEIMSLSLFGSPNKSMDPAKCMILSGMDNCNVTGSISIGIIKPKIVLDCVYDGAPISVDDFVDSVTRLMISIFNGDAILERLNDSNNRRKDLRVVCEKDGVHIRWEEVEATHWSLGYGEEIVPYEAANVLIPKEQMTRELLTRLEGSIENAILAQTRFVKNEYGCFVLGTKKSSLY